MNFKLNKSLKFLGIFLFFISYSHSSMLLDPFREDFEQLKRLYDYAGKSSFDDLKKFGSYTTTGSGVPLNALVDVPIFGYVGVKQVSKYLSITSKTIVDEVKNEVNVSLDVNFRLGFTNLKVYDDNVLIDKDNWKKEFHENYLDFLFLQYVKAFSGETEVKVPLVDVDSEQSFTQINSNLVQSVASNIDTNQRSVAYVESDIDSINHETNQIQAASTTKKVLFDLDLFDESKFQVLKFEILAKKEFGQLIIIDEFVKTVKTAAFFIVQFKDFQGCVRREKIVFSKELPFPNQIISINPFYKKCKDLHNLVQFEDTDDIVDSSIYKLKTFKKD